MTTREKLNALADNLWWSWNPEALDLFRRLNPEVFQATRQNPVMVLRSADENVLASEDFARDVDTVYRAFRQYMADGARNGRKPRTSYFCMEYGLHESLPFYAGGLGVLAGDHAKAASDLGLPFTAVGLFLRTGYFRQSFDSEGWQQADYPALDPSEHPLTLVTEASGAPLTVTVHLGQVPLHLQAWRLEVGRTTLYLLDSDFDANTPELRALTRHLYGGSRTTRLQQEIVLGIGGLRLLRALGVETDVYHLNEGHCAFLLLELLRERLAHGESRTSAEAWVRERCVFTTHTPVMAGHDRFAHDLFTEQMCGFREELGLTEHELLAYGRTNPEHDEEAFTMTVLALQLTRQANGVSALNGEVARAQWHLLYPERPVEEVPIGHITNGVHLPTWTAPLARAFLNERLGDWKAHRHEPSFWQRVADLPDEALWQYRCALRALLVDFANEYARAQTLPQTPALDPEALTIGFARRFATYKRAPLLFSDPEKAIELFSQPGRPVQILYAGKAHPHDDGGKRFLQQIYRMSRHPALKGRVVLLENYDMEIGRLLVSGCDVWLNNPRRPMEASGTSGQKVTLHGGLNCSILDGWWPEGYDGTNGWAIENNLPEDHQSQEVRDAADAEALYRVLGEEVIPAFYERTAEGLPTRWIARMKRAMQTLPARFSARRMVADYLEEMYAAAPHTVSG